MSAIFGATASINAGVDDVRLPWCGIRSASLFNALFAERAMISRSLSASMSAVSSALTRVLLTLMTQERSLVFRDSSK